MKFYPIQFTPILKERIWGGTQLKSLLNKSVTDDKTGESWEISSVPNDVSIVASGSYKGKSLNDLISEFPTQLLGSSVYSRFGNQFPLLFKFIDAREDLSIQLHPNDELAQKRHNSFGKTEMWYVMHADEGARMIVGFKEKSSSEEYLKHLHDKSLLSILDSKKVKEGDVFFLETGTIHAIGAGIVVAEIQQTSDITYRVYDFDRVDANGNQRELHIDLALDAINYDVVEVQRTYEKAENEINTVVECPYFTTNFIKVTDRVTIATNPETFKVLMVVSGNCELIMEGESYSYVKGDTLLIPAAAPSFELKGSSSVLEIYIK
jgi:mannose-6-phosphate isomerase